MCAKLPEDSVTAPLNQDRLFVKRLFVVPPGQLNSYGEDPTGAGPSTVVMAPAALISLKPLVNEISLGFSFLVNVLPMACLPAVRIKTTF